MSRKNAMGLQRGHEKTGGLRGCKPNSDLIMHDSGEMKARITAPLVAFDLLATGTGKEIIEIGAVRYENGAEVAEFSTYVDPGRFLSPEEIGFGGVDSAQLIGAPGLRDAIVAFDGFIKGAVLASHRNSFNAWMLRKAYEKVGMALTSATIDALPFSRRLFDALRRRYPYPDYLMADFIAPCAEPYRAVECARACGGEILMALNDLGAEWDCQSNSESDPA